MPVMPRPAGKAKNIHLTLKKERETDTVEDNGIDFTKGITKDKDLEKEMRQKIRR